MASKARVMEASVRPNWSKSQFWKCSTRCTDSMAEWRLNVRKSSKPMVGVLNGLMEANTASTSFRVFFFSQSLILLLFAFTFLSAVACRRPASKSSKLILSAPTVLFRNSNALWRAPNGASNASHKSCKTSGVAVGTPNFSSDCNSPAVIMPSMSRSTKEMSYTPSSGARPARRSSSSKSSRGIASTSRGGSRKAGEHGSNTPLTRCSAGSGSWPAKGARSLSKGVKLQRSSSSAVGISTRATRRSTSRRPRCSARRKPKASRFRWPSTSMPDCTCHWVLGCTASRTVLKETSR
mmetsp:Transcript_114282/g.357381  ORF Transcript_114282/g.357381 Transcript_114282/m.357381 type:complete len:294 (+) Transcript_114282:1112-1993(+)